MRPSLIVGTIVIASLPSLTQPPLRSTHPRQAHTIVLTSPAPGHQVRFRGIVLLPDRPMRLLNGITPFEIRVPDDVVLGAFEAEDSAATLTLDYDFGVPPDARTTSHRVMMGQAVGGVATAFVQRY